ncbi:MAG: hypothetical protein FD133_495 [Erysipelotrichaceae bacterium]|nr:MAG: hypothetical protein FD133_495 [Erysipelotrichaceae bacterium]
MKEYQFKKTNIYYLTDILRLIYLKASVKLEFKLPVFVLKVIVNRKRVFSDSFTYRYEIESLPQDRQSLCP